MSSRLLIRALAILVTFVGCLVMLGWILDVAVLKSILPIWVTMKFTTALSFTLSGVLVLGVDWYREKGNVLSRWVVALLSFSVLFLMTSLAASVLLEIQTGIEDLFVIEAHDAILTIVPGQPSLGTMGAFILIGLVGLFAAFHAIRDRMIQVMGVIVALLGVVALIGYVASMPALYYAISGLSTAMAFHTAILFVLLGVSIVIMGSVPSGTRVGMTIRDKSFLIVFISLFAMAVFAMVLQTTSRLEELVIARQTLMSDISDTLFTRNVLLVDFIVLADSSERALHQLTLLDDEVNTLILSLGPYLNDSDTVKTYDQLVRSRNLVQTDLERLFAQIQRDPSGEGLLLNDPYVRELVSRIFFQSQVTSDKVRLLSQMSIQEMLLVHQRTSRMFILSFVVLMLYAGFVLLTIIQSVVRPVQTLLVGAEAMADGDFTQRVDVRRKDELGELSKAFNTMATRLGASRMILEGQVKDRTSELEQMKGSLEKRVGEKTKELQEIKVHLEEEVALRTKELERKLQEVERLNATMVGRELRMAELKKELKAQAQTNPKT